MRLLPRRAADDSLDSAADSATSAPAEDLVDSAASTSKGRPTPKRRDADPRRGPVAAPKSRKEAVQRQRQQLKQNKANGTSATPQQRRAQILAGDQRALPARDSGPVRALARDYVDSHRMLSNGLLILFPLIAISVFLKTPVINILILAIFAAVVMEWLITGRRIIALAKERGIELTRKDTAFGVGFYGGTRAYLPRKWRVPRARVNMGDPV